MTNHPSRVALNNLRIANPPLHFDQRVYVLVSIFLGASKMPNATEEEIEGHREILSAMVQEMIEDYVENDLGA